MLLLLERFLPLDPFFEPPWKVKKPPLFSARLYKMCVKETDRQPSQSLGIACGIGRHHFSRNLIVKFQPLELAAHFEVILFRTLIALLSDFGTLPVIVVSSLFIDLRSISWH